MQFIINELFVFYLDSHEAEAVQAHLRTIEYELGEGERITNKTQLDLESLIRDFSNTETIINEVVYCLTQTTGVVYLICCHTQDNTESVICCNALG